MSESCKKYVATLAKPIAIEVNGDEGRRNGEVVDERVEFDQKRQLLRSSHKLHNRIHKTSALVYDAVLIVSFFVKGQIY